MCGWSSINFKVIWWWSLATSFQNFAVFPHFWTVDSNSLLISSTWSWHPTLNLLNHLKTCVWDRALFPQTIWRILHFPLAAFPQFERKLDVHLLFYEKEKHGSCTGLLCMKWLSQHFLFTSLLFSKDELTQSGHSLFIHLILMQQHHSQKLVWPYTAGNTPDKHWVSSKMDGMQHWYEGI